MPFVISCIYIHALLKWQVTYDPEERDYAIVNLEHKLSFNHHARRGVTTLVAGTVKTHWLIIPDGSTFM